jgi:hypothetical protein
VRKNRRYKLVKEGGNLGAGIIAAPICCYETVEGTTAVRNPDRTTR